MRVRYEAIDDQVRPGFARDDDGLFVRTTLFAGYTTGRLKFGAELWDSRAYGVGRRSAVGTGEVNALELVQAYAIADLSDATVQAGRFTLNLGSRRLVAADDYRNTTNGSTGLRVDAKLPGRLAATLFYVLPQMRRPDDVGSILDNEVEVDRESFDLQLWGGLLTRRAAANALLTELGYVGLTERDDAGRPTRDRRLHTISARLLREPAKARWDYEVEGIYQTGTVSASAAPTAPELDVSAWFLHAEAGYTFADAWKTHLSFEFDQAGGDRPGGKYGRFDTLFGMRRADLAPAGLYNAVGRANLIATGVRVETVPSKRLDLFAAYRPLWLASRTDAFSTTGVRDPNGASGRFAGHQVEGRARWWAVPDRLRAEVNALWLARGRFLRDAPNAPPGRATHYLTVSMMASF